MEGNYTKWLNRINSKQDVLTDDSVGQFMDLELPTKLTPTSGDTVLARDILTNKAVEIPIESLGGGGSGLALGETSSTAYRGDRGKIAYDHSQVPHDKTLVGLGNVDNTSDLNKPISTATQNALNLKADKGLNIKITTPSNWVTGTTSETEVLRIEIPANSLSASDVLRIPFLMINKVGTNGTIQIKGRMSTSPTMPSGTTDQLFQTAIVGATNQYVGLDRSFVIDGGKLKGFPHGNTSYSSSGVGLNTIASKPFDRTVTNYLYVSIILANTADQARLEGMQLTNA